MKKTSAFIFLLLMYLCGIAQKRQQAQILKLDGLYIGLEKEYFERHFDDTLIKWFGKKKAGDILIGLEANAWPQSAFNAVINDLDVTEKYFKQCRVWQILNFEKNKSILEVRPEDNKFLQDTSFKKPYYILFVKNENLSIGKWSPVPDVITGVAGADDINRKNILATLKKKYVTQDRKIKYENLKVEVKGGESLTIPTKFDKALKKILVVMTNGENNPVVILYDGDNGEDKMEEPGTTENIDGYTVSRFSFFNKSDKIQIGMAKNITADYTILMFAEKNDKAYAEYQKAKLEKGEALEKQNAANKAKLTSQYSAEYQEARSAIIQILNKVDVFIRQTEWVLDFTNSGAERNNWGWNEYNKYYKTIKEAYSSVISVYNSHKVSISPGNTEYNKIVDWFSNISTQNHNIQDEINRLDNVIENSKSPSLITYRMAYQNLIRFGKKIYEMSY